nr:hypothetical protein [Tanacetum cinerariifolium]
MAEEEDRISCLPDLLLVEIISRIKVKIKDYYYEEEEKEEEILMTTKEAIKTTSTISKRWQHLWKKLATLSFIYFYDGDFYDDVTRVIVGDLIGIILSGSPCLETLELHNCYGVSRIHASSKKFKNLVLTNYGMSHRLADSLGRHRDDIEEELLSGLLSSLAHAKDITLGDYNCLDFSRVGADGDEYRITELMDGAVAAAPET